MTARFFSSLTRQDTPVYLQSNMKLYERQPVTDLWNRLTKVTEKQWSWLAVADQDRWVAAVKRVIIVSGPPGNGKSSACYEWAVRTCQQEWVDCVTWMDCATKERDPGAWLLRGSSQSPGQCSATSVPIPQRSDEFTGKVVVFDGLRAETTESWIGVIAKLCRRGVAVILCSSESVRIHLGNTQDIIQLRHRFPAWSPEEYKRAGEDDEFWSQTRDRLPGSLPQNASRLQRESALEQKFEFAGHCARFMFLFPIPLIKEHVEEGVEALGNSIESMQAALTMNRNTGAINRLIAFVNNNGPTPAQTSALPTKVPAAPGRRSLQVQDDEFDPSRSKNIFVSAFAAQEILLSMPKSVDKLRTVAATTRNRAIEGYALEIRLQEKLQQARDTRIPLSVVSISGQPESWNVAAFQEETPESIKDAVVHGADDYWFWIGGNQGGFLRQVSLNGKSFSTVDFVTLRPSDDRREFSLDPPRGRLEQGWNYFAGRPWATGRDARTHARVLKLDW